MKKVYARVVSVILSWGLILSLASCNTVKNEDPAVQDKESRTKIRITWWGGQTRHQNTKELLELYSELHPEIEFETLPAEWDGYFDQLSIQAASGALPDIVQMDYQFISTYGKNGALTDLAPFIEDGTIDTSGVEKELLDTGRVGERTVGLVITTSMLCVGYNPKVLADAGVEEPETGWTWSDFAEDAGKVSQATGEPSVMTAAGVAKDMNIFHYWVRQHGASLFNEDGTALGFEDPSITAGFFELWKNLTDEHISPNPDEMAQIISRGQDNNPIAVDEAGYIFEWNNYAVKMAKVNDHIKITQPPLLEAPADDRDKGLWNKPGMFLSIAETSGVKKECAEFINWVVNSKEANDIIMAERGTPVAKEVRRYMLDSGKMSPQQEEMFQYEEKSRKYCGFTPNADPMGISDVNQAFNDAANKVFYGQLTPRQAAEEFHQKANQILESEDTL